MSIGPIPWTAVDAYARSRGLSAPMSRILETVIAEMEAGFFEWCDRQRADAAEQARREREESAK